MIKQNIAVYGCGNMAGALVKGIYNLNKDILFHTYTPSFTRAHELALATKGRSYRDLKDIPVCDYYIIACKPQQINDLAESLKGIIPQNKIIVSLVTGVHIVDLQKYFNSNEIIRVMPNTPSLIGEGVSLVFASDSIKKDKLDYIVAQLKIVSEVLILKKEKAIDDYIGISASGPAYIFELARILTKKAEQLGLSFEEASTMVKQMIYGSAKLMLTSKDSPEELRNKVTSKGGVTYEALETLKDYRLEASFNSAIDKATERSLELGK